MQLKICGLAREADVAEAEALGASHVGVVLAPGPRQQTLARAAELLGAARSARRVAVFGRTSPADVAAAAAALPCDVVQLHGDPTASDIAAVRELFGGEVWGVLRIAGADFPGTAAALVDVADAVVLDARPAAGGGSLGGSGTSFDWAAAAARLDSPRGRLRGGARLVVAGGLTAENVAEAIRLLRPDVVDVSSGVERAPGEKDATLMRRFAAAAGAVRPLRSPTDDRAR